MPLQNQSGRRYRSPGNDYARRYNSNLVGPVASFTFSPTSGDIPFSPTFTDTSTQGDAVINTYSWDFGDNNSSTDQNPTNTFTTAGTFQVTLTVTDANGLSDQQIQDVIVTEAAGNGPTAGFAFVNGTTNSGDQPHSIELDSTSTTGTSAIANHFWDFGDGNDQDGGFSGVTHTYTDPGSFTITLTVTDANGLQDVATQLVTVNAITNPPPVASFTRTPSGGDIPLTVAFDASASTDNGSIASYSWDFGDGSPAGSGASPSHTYTVAGSYTVTLTVTDNEGATDTATQNVGASTPGSGEIVSNVINRVFADNFASTGSVSQAEILQQGPFDFATKGFGNGYQNRNLVDIVDNPAGLPAGRWMRTIRPGGLDAHTFSKAIRVVGQTSNTYPNGFTEFWMKTEFYITSDWRSQNQGKIGYSFSNIGGASPGSNPTNSTELLMHWFGPRSPKTSGIWPSTNPPEPSGGWSDQAIIMGADVYARDPRITNSFSEPIIFREDATSGSLERAVYDVGDHCVFWLHYKHNTGSNQDGVLKGWHSRDGGASYKLGVNIPDMLWSDNNTLLQYPGFVQFYGGSGVGFEPGGGPCQNNGSTHAVQDYWVFIKELRTQADNPLPSIFV